MCKQRNINLIEMSEHINYEIQMLVYAFECIIHDEKVITPDKNMHIECFLLHARNLSEFFTRKRNKFNKDNIFATDFPNIESIANSFKEIPQFSDIHKTLAHISTERPRLKKVDWEYGKISGDLKFNILLFRNNIDAKNYNKNYYGQLDQFINALGAAIQAFQKRSIHRSTPATSSHF
jgi:hypothetical protein